MDIINFCPNCGENLKDLADNASFCTKCGARIKKDTPDSIVEKVDEKKIVPFENIEDTNLTKKNSNEPWIVVLVVLSLAGIIYYVTYTPNKKRNKNPNTYDFSVPTTSTQGIKFVKTNIEYDEYTDIHTIHCKIENNSGRLISYIDLKGIFYDNNGNIIGTGLGNETNFPNGYTKVVDIIATGVVNPKKYDVQIGNVIYE